MEFKQDVALDLTPIVVARDMPRYQAVYNQLTEEVVEIQQQISDPVRREEMERMGGYRAYQEWKRRATRAMNALAARKREVKAAMQAARPLLRVAPNTEITTIEDWPGFAAGTLPGIRKLLVRLAAMRLSLEGDEDFADLADCLEENLGELREWLESCLG